MYRLDCNAVCGRRLFWASRCFWFSGGFKGEAVGAAAPYWLRVFQISPFSRIKGIEFVVYIFDKVRRADTLSSAPPSPFPKCLDPPLRIGCLLFVRPTTETRSLDENTACKVCTADVMSTSWQLHGDSGCVVDRANSGH